MSKNINKAKLIQLLQPEQPSPNLWKTIKKEFDESTEIDISISGTRPQDNITASGARALIQALEGNQTITRIDLSGQVLLNQAQALINALEGNQTITEIILASSARNQLEQSTIDGLGQVLHFDNE